MCRHDSSEYTHFSQHTNHMWAVATQFYASRRADTHAHVAVIAIEQVAEIAKELIRAAIKIVTCGWINRYYLLLLLLWSLCDDFNIERNGNEQKVDAFRNFAIAQDTEQNR